MITRSAYETSLANYKIAEADVAVAQAEVTQANASVEQAKAALDKAERNLAHCTIKSPVRGTIIDRRVNIGQTVVSNLSVSSMFLIARDLSHMQVWVSVNETDIDHIKPGQNVTFTCDGLSGEKFNGTVGKVRLNAQSSQNVVVYTVEVNTDNTGQRLLPYITANVEFQVRRDPNLLIVPNAALLWYPGSAAEVAAEARAEWKRVDDQDEQPHAGPDPSEPLKLDKQAEGRGTIWLLQNKVVRPVEVTLGPSDSTRTEVRPVKPNAITEGDNVVVGEFSER